MTLAGGISVTSFLEHLSRDLLEFWDGGSKYLSHNHLSHNVYCKKYDPCKRYNTSSNRFTFLGISVTSYLEHLSHNICRVIFWNFWMASAKCIKTGVLYLFLNGKFM